MSGAIEAEIVAKALKGQRNGRGWLCRCPAHDDRTPSLSVTSGTDGRLLLYCHAGCTFLEVRAALEKLGVLADRPMPPGYRRAIKAHAPPPKPAKPIPDKAKVSLERMPADRAGHHCHHLLGAARLRSAAS
jgi:hypothetical protein